MATTTKPKEDVDFSTYRANPDDMQSGWNWYCMHCATGRGWRWARVDARRDARTHAAPCMEVK